MGYQQQRTRPGNRPFSVNAYIQDDSSAAITRSKPSGLGRP